MNITGQSIRNQLQTCYDVREASCLARIVCCEMLGQSSTDYYIGKDMVLSGNMQHEYEDIMARLLKFEPIQYIQGYAHFAGRCFKVTPAVLIPRQETEELVERMVQEVPRGAVVLDIGTGSGCIAVTLSKERPDTKVTAMDVSPEALAVAQLNNDALQASVRFVHQDVLTYEVDEKEQIDVIVSNPPYVLERERLVMERNVLDWEPSLALFVSDSDPLLFYRRIAMLGRDLLRPGGKIYFEINRDFGAATVDMLAQMGYVNPCVWQDISHNDRFVTAEK